MAAEGYGAYLDQVEAFDESRKSHPGRRLFLGNAGSHPQAARHHLDSCGLHRRRCSERHVSQSRHACRGIEIIFDPELTSYRKILEFFFQIHDPTTKNRQGNDRGLSYRSAIYYLGVEQKHVAEETIADVDASGLLGWQSGHRGRAGRRFLGGRAGAPDYLEKLPGGYTCHFPTCRLDPSKAQKRGACAGIGRG
jgi:peptide methionine sulfoxide reductase MsrA